MPNARIGKPAYDRLLARRDKWALERDGQVTITEALERLLDIVDAVDELEGPARGRHALARHTAPAATFTDWEGPLP